jgi:LEA14-like dessication related protein
MKKFFAPFFLITLFAAFGTGCGTNNLMVGLQVELTGITRAADGTTEVSWRVHNPNVVSYLLAETTHKIHLNGKMVGTVRQKQALAVPASSTIEGAAVMTVAGAEGERVLTEALAAGKASYQVEVAVVVRLYGDTTDKSTLSMRGTIPVTAK